VRKQKPLAPEAATPGGKVLVIGDDVRSFLAVVRSLGRRGVEVHVVPIVRSAPALSSRHIAAVHQLPYYEANGGHWLSETRRLLDREQFDLVIPLDDRSIIPFHAHREEFAPYRLALPSIEAFDVMFSKEGTRELADSLHIPVARGRQSRARETADTILRDFTLPLVLKPLSSFSMENLYEKSLVRRVESKEQLEHRLAGEFRRTNFVIEKIFLGEGVGVSVLARDGVILQAFEHHRVHEPPGGGGSSYRVSAPLQAELVDACSKFVAALAYTGVAMFEFRQNPATRRWILLEVNGRFWGSLPLAIAAGIDFPSLLFDLLVLGKSTARASYRYGIYSRSISDDYWYYRYKLSDCRASFSRSWRLFADTVMELGHVFRGVERIDTLALDDLRPAFRDVGGLIGQPVERLSRALLRRVRLYRSMQARRIDQALKLARSERPLNLLFVCKGNICRSPFAASLARSALPSVRCESAGILPLSGRGSPREAIESARDLGVDLADHRSQILSDDMIDGDALIFAFDFENLAYLRAAYPAAHDRLFLLGSYGEDASASCEISDPFGGPRSAYRECYDRIRGAIDMLAQRSQRLRAEAPLVHSEGLRP
jgi:protein-tyrosine-phosphatase/predicted ATP-grasp superfamily ATP-dependent carboligase